VKNIPLTGEVQFVSGKNFYRQSYRDFCIGCVTFKHEQLQSAAGELRND
jgi:hypothetical protein